MKTIIFFGGGILLTKLIKITKSKKINLMVFTSVRHAKEKVSKKLSLENFLVKNKINFDITSKLKENKLKKYVKNNDCIGFSVGSAWIFKKNIIDIFKSRIYNLHGADLPSDRGGGGFSWQILQGKTLGYSCLHKINEKIDDGDIIQTKRFNTKKCNNPNDWQERYIKTSTQIFRKNLSELFLNKINARKQLKKNSIYWPRLDTEIHGWINWDWSTNEIKSFINAFGDPYPGAHTFINKKKIYLKNCKIKKKHNFHPFQFGLIIKKSRSSILVSVRNGIIEVKNVFDEQKREFRKFKVGDRFFTPKKKLVNALTKRVYFNL